MSSRHFFEQGMRALSVLCLVLSFSISATAQDIFDTAGFVAPASTLAARKAELHALDQETSRRYVAQLYQPTRFTDLEGQNAALLEAAMSDVSGDMVAGLTRALDLKSADIFQPPFREGSEYIFIGSIASADAEALRLQVNLDGLNDDTLYLIDPTAPRAFGPFHSDDNVDGGRWLPTVQGEEAILVVRSLSSLPPEITVLALAHFFMNPGSVQKDNALSCNVLIECVDDDNIRSTVSTAIGRMTYASGEQHFICSGSLLNVSATQEFEPYFFTANHCIGTLNEALSAEVFWDFRVPECAVDAEEPELSSLPRSNGANLLAVNSTLDTTLIELGTVPAGQHGRSYLGWTTARPSINDNIFGIHHPRGGHMRFSQGSISDLDATIRTTNGDVWERETGVLWSEGLTEPGSSGSPLMLLATSTVIGALSAGPADADCDTTPAAFYSSFRDFFPQVSSFLNPTGTQNPDLEVLDVFFSTEPAGAGSIIGVPILGQNVFPNVRYRVTDPDAFSGQIWSLELDGVVLCSFTGTLDDASVQLGWCSVPWQSTLGMHELCAVLDPANSVVEESETNNVLCTSFKIEEPGDTDLEVLEVFFRDRPGDQGNIIENPQPGQQVYAHIRYRSVSPPSINGTIWSIDLDGVELCTFEGLLTPGEDRVGWCTLPWNAISGNHEVCATVDPDSVVAEADESNTLCLDFFVPNPPMPTDLEIIEVFFRDQPQNQGNVVDMPVVGQEVYPHIRYQSTDPQGQMGTLWEIKLDGQLLCELAGAVDTAGMRTGWCTAPWIVLDGTHQLCATLDPAQTITEANEFNNFLCLSFTASTSSGSIRIDIEPAGAVTAGAQWRITQTDDTTQWRNSGETAQTLLPGTYTVRFKSIDEWQSPGDQVIDLTADEELSLVVEYIFTGGTDGCFSMQGPAAQTGRPQLADLALMLFVCATLTLHARRRPHARIDKH